MGGLLVLYVVFAVVMVALGVNASFVLVIMTLGMNGLAIWLRYRLRKNLKW